MKRLALTLVLLSSTAYAEPAEVSRNVDGDTAYFLWGGVEVKVRFSGVDTPETGSQAKCLLERWRGQRASDYIKDRLYPGKPVELLPETKRDGARKLDKYGRPLAWVYDSDGSVTHDLIRLGLGRPNRGGTKSNWCEE